MKVNKRKFYEQPFFGRHGLSRDLAVDIENSGKLGPPVELAPEAAVLIGKAEILAHTLGFEIAP